MGSDDSASGRVTINGINGTHVSAPRGGVCAASTNTRSASRVAKAESMRPDYEGGERVDAFTLPFGINALHAQVDDEGARQFVPTLTAAARELRRRITVVISADEAGKTHKDQPLIVTSQ